MYSTLSKEIQAVQVRLYESLLLVFKTAGFPILEYA